MIPVMINTKPRIRSMCADSPRKTMPNMTVPMMPIPTQIAAAVPAGSVRIAIPNKPRLVMIVTTVNTVGHNRVKPSVYFSPTAHPVSNNAAMIRINQFVTLSLIFGVVPVK